MDQNALRFQSEAGNAVANTFDAGVPVISRRGVLAGLGGAAAAGLAPMRSASADIVGLVVVGGDGWLYPIWDEVRRFDAARFQQVTTLINNSVAVMKKAGIEVVISLTPSKSRIYREFLPKDFQFTAETEKRYVMALDALRKPGTLVPDQATAFIEARKANPQGQYFFKTDTHWTPLGAELAGKLIASEVNAKLKLPASKKPGVKLGDPMQMVQAKNDLADQMPAAEKAKYTKEFYTIRKDLSAADAGSALTEDDSSDTVVVGNSYTQPKYGFSATISAGLNRPVGLAWRVHQFGSYAILLEYLASPAFKQSRPKLIVWDFEETDMEGSPERKDFWGEHAMTGETFLSKLTAAVAV